MFVVGLAMLIAGVPFYSQNHAFLIVSVIGFVVMFAGVVVATTGPRTGAKDKANPPSGGPRAKKSQGLRGVVHQSHGGPVPPSVRRVNH